MRRSRFTDEQIIRILGMAEAGQKVGDICRQNGISEGTFYRWRAKYGGLDRKELKRLKALESESWPSTSRTVGRPTGSQRLILINKWPKWGTVVLRTMNREFATDEVSRHRYTWARCSPTDITAK
jgi:putative transposase